LLKLTANNHVTKQHQTSILFVFEGWEEMADTSLTTLLKTSLSRNDGVQSLGTTVNLEVPPDTVKVKLDWSNYWFSSIVNS